jgi:hypothetical protein
MFTFSDDTIGCIPGQQIVNNDLAYYEKDPKIITRLIPGDS